MNNPLGKGGCGNEAGRKSDKFHFDKVASRFGLSLTIGNEDSSTDDPALGIGPGEYIRVGLGRGFAIRNLITGIKFPFATWTFTDSIIRENSDSVRT